MRVWGETRGAVAEHTGLSYSKGEVGTKRGRIGRSRERMKGEEEETKR